MNADPRLIQPLDEPDDSPPAIAPLIPIRKWARADRPRERLLDAGPASLSDAELFALFLRTGVCGATAVDVARQLLRRFGSLRGVLDASAAELRELRGIGPARAATLIAVSELCRRALAEKARDRELLNAPGAVEDYLRLLIGTRPYEVFICLYLDARHQLLHVEESARGSLTRVAVYPREIVRRALTLNAAGLIVAHNHPSGGVEPSASDRRLTKTLQDALTLIDVRLLDHIVVAANEVFSFARHGWL
ncbi:RadC family protein [Caballeronia glebae]|uniref:DNA repair protein RadC n=1 Tax=Caballeronia glebae TaxID=1777143 RepID=A0A158BFJ9_9BURK|nr:DNA repair protein RadC [Caballeronia glebae]SAK68813.1 DNA repair protein RadC [Caballeronia glebae]